ncbi:T9SS type A sorting domain-containing protein [Flavobacterium wongokense]|uniref:T9SS type A sorting domain-containing protein n=1 Tax=Flavobacterium wongokense TaxID=2910674 RepID=UPI001F32B317|nr:T9SS type A sorting domain-containing protein [Flavobacterium sp. WG47]MCF6130680.1 T9SS type A sorting domain-containing protein [Flavobacterium sp. WG47]
MAHFYSNPVDSKTTVFKYFLGLFFLFDSFVSFGQQYQWTRTLDTNSYCYSGGIKTDSQGNVFSYGQIIGTADVDPSAAVYNVTDSTYILKYDSNGNFLWVKTLSTSTSIACLEFDQNGNLLLTGGLHATQDFDFGPGQYLLYPTGLGSGFAAKLTADAEFIWAKSYTSVHDVSGSSIKSDANNNVIVSGVFRSAVNFNPGGVSQTLDTNGAYRGFCLKLAANGDFIWVKQIVASDTRDSAIDSQGNIYITGWMSNIYDTFIKKLNPQGDEIWNYELTGSSTDWIHGIEVDHNDNLIACGEATSGIDFNPSSQINTINSNAWQFIVKFDAAGNFMWVKGIQGYTCEDLKIDENNYIYVTGDLNWNFYYYPDTLTQILCFSVSYQAQYAISLNPQGDYYWGTNQKNNGSSNVWARMGLYGSNLYLTCVYKGNADFNPRGSHDYATAMGPQSIYISKFDTALLSNSEFERGSIKLLNNPVGDMLYLSFDDEGDKQLGIYSVEGKLVRKQTVSGDYATIEVGGLAGGIYLIQCRSELGSMALKFVKE